jgi:Terminase RNaseH-like domain
MALVVIGVDVGQRVDPSAVAVAEAQQRARPGGGVEAHYVIRHLERLPLGTPYPTVAARVAALVANVGKHAASSPIIYVDATGVGTPVVDELRRAGILGRLVPVYFTHGDRRTVEHGEVKLGKAWLVSRLQALLQGGRLHVPRTSEAEALAKELQDYEIKVDQNANDTYGAFKVGSHDDLVTALGLACQEEPPRPFTAVVGGYRTWSDPDGPPQDRPSRSLGSMWEPSIEELRRR